MAKRTETKKAATKEIKDESQSVVLEEKKVQLNKETLSVGLNFNVKKFKDWIKNHCNQVHNFENMKIGRAHV